MYILLPLVIWLVACGDIPKEGDGSEKVEVKLELQYDNTTNGPLKRYVK